MNFTDEELEALHGIVLDHALYGDGEIVYGDGPEARMARSLLEILTEEAKSRKFWWA